MQEGLEERYATVPGGDVVGHLYQTGAGADALETGDDETLEELRRKVKALLGLAENSLATIDLDLVTNDLLSPLGTAAATVTTQMAATPVDPAALDAAVAGFADHVRRLVAVAGTATVPALTDAQQRLEASVADASAEIEGLKAERSNLAEEIGSLTQQSADLLAAKTSDLDALLDGGAAKLDNVAATGRAQYEEDRTALVKYGEETMQSAEETLSELRRVLSIAGDESVSANYGNRADTEDQTADMMRSRAVWFGVATALAGVLAVAAQMAAGAQDWSYSAWAMWPAKFTVIATLGALSAYHGRQAAHHRSYAQHLRTAQLELHNLGPYLAELDPEQRARVREELVRTFFGNSGPEVKVDSPTPAGTLDQVIEILKLAGKGDDG